MEPKEIKEPLGVFSAIPKIMKKVGAVKETKKADAKLGGYKYRGIDDIRSALQPLFAEHGVFLFPQVELSKLERFQTANGAHMNKATVRVKYICHHQDGSCFIGSSEGEAMDSGDKATQKAMTNANKIFLEQLFSLPTEEHQSNDNQPSYNNSHYEQRYEPKPKAQPIQNLAPPKPKVWVFPDGPFKGKSFEKCPFDRLSEYFFHCEKTIKEKEIKAPDWFEPLGEYVKKQIEETNG